MSALVVCCLLSLPLTATEAQITLDGSLGPGGSLTGPNYVIGAQVGQLRGTNLFHSFGLFNVQTGESATFTGQNFVTNVLSRVTGGQLSTIDGLISTRATMPNANFFLLNPAGVLFGPNATLDVGGSVRVSTADYLRFADGTAFFADLGRQSVLSVADVAAFGFLRAPTAGITVNGSALQVDPGQTLSLVGGGVQVSGGASAGNVGALVANSGRIEIASVASAGEVTLVNAARRARSRRDVVLAARFHNDLGWRLSRRERRARTQRKRRHTRRSAGRRPGDDPGRDYRHRQWCWSRSRHPDNGRCRSHGQRHLVCHARKRRRRRHPCDGGYSSNRQWRLHQSSHCRKWARRRYRC